MILPSITRKTERMNLESLPNVILLDLFSYVNSIDLLRIFFGLNTRFNQLLYEQYYSYCFQFNRISKRHFDEICQRHLPHIAHGVVRLQLSEYKETPEQMNLFLRHIPSWKSFIHLQSLTILNLRSYPILTRLIGECRNLVNLTHLQFYSCTFRDSSANSQWIMDEMWSLPKLKSCHANIRIEGENTFSIPTIESQSIENVSLLFDDPQWTELNQLIQSTPNLKSLSISIRLSLRHSHPELTFPTLTRCDLYLDDIAVVPTLDLFFPSMPLLRTLDVYIWDGIINGTQWERIIHHYLPQLKIFRLTMEKTFEGQENTTELAKEFFQSFHNPFWIDEHKWFIRCFTMNKSIYLSSQINISHSFPNLCLHSYQSTYPNDDPQQIYQHLTSIYDETFFDQPISSSIHLSNIDYLRIKFPLNDQMNSIISNLNRLKTLLIVSYRDTYSTELQQFLDRSPSLQSLYVNQDRSLPLQTSIFQQRNSSIREVYLFSNEYFFDENECLLFIHSPLSIQCEVLSLQVLHRQSILYLIQNLPNLRSLIVSCQDQQTELLPWLKEHLSSEYLITTDPDNVQTILIWI